MDGMQTPTHDLLAVLGLDSSTEALHAAVTTVVLAAGIIVAVVAYAVAFVHFTAAAGVVLDLKVRVHTQARYAVFFRGIRSAAISCTQS